MKPHVVWVRGALARAAYGTALQRRPLLNLERGVSGSTEPDKGDHGQTGH